MENLWGLYAMHQAGAFFLTRAKENMDARRLYSHPVDRAQGIFCDQRVILNGFYSAKNYPEHLRRIRLKDPDNGKALVLLTNNTIPACSDNHGALQEPDLARGGHLWADYYCQEAMNLDASLNTRLQILSVSIFEKTEISCALQPYLSQHNLSTSPNQLNLFDI